MDIKEDLKARLSEMRLGEIQVVAMVDRGAYRDLLAEEESGEEKTWSDSLAEIAQELKVADEDVTIIARSDRNLALTQADLDKFLSGLIEKSHLILIECLDLGTTEIKAILYALQSRSFLEQSKIFLIDLPQLEYLTLRDSLSGKISI